ncbi:hypothetical protein [Streptomyces flaveolus]|uniref:hypothetical protein n=1 Tax=Streptomyces flaveolus TaxID=67297 RepID=UPI0033D6ECA8
MLPLEAIESDAFRRQHDGSRRAAPESNQEEFDALDRGVLYRALYEHATRSWPSAGSTDTLCLPEVSV